jgi:hypothetical protein
MKATTPDDESSHDDELDSETSQTSDDIQCVPQKVPSIEIILLLLGTFLGTHCILEA